MSEEKNVNIGEKMNEAAFETTKKYYQILKDEFGIEFSYAFSLDENGLTVYHEKIVSMAGCGGRFVLSRDFVGMTVDIVPQERNEYLNKLIAALAFAAMILDLVDEAESVGLTFLRCDIEKNIVGDANLWPMVSFFDAANGNSRSFVCDVDGLNLFGNLICRQLSLKLLAEKANGLSRRGVHVSIKPDDNTYSFVFDPKLIYPDVKKFEDKFRSFCIEHKDYFGFAWPLPRKRSELHFLEEMIDEIFLGVNNCTIEQG